MTTEPIDLRALTAEQDPALDPGIAVMTNYSVEETKAKLREWLGEQRAAADALAHPDLEAARVAIEREAHIAFCLPTKHHPIKPGQPDHRPCRMPLAVAERVVLAALGSPAPCPHEGRPVLHPCHVTGTHTPDHHLLSDRVCSEQARDIAKQLLAGRSMETLPRALHADCYWCGTRADHGEFVSRADAQAAWLAAAPAPETKEYNDAQS